MYNTTVARGRQLLPPNVLALDHIQSRVMKMEVIRQKVKYLGTWHRCSEALVSVSIEDDDGQTILQSSSVRHEYRGLGTSVGKYSSRGDKKM